MSRVGTPAFKAKLNVGKSFTSLILVHYSLIRCLGSGNEQPHGMMSCPKSDSVNTLITIVLT